MTDQAQVNFRAMGAACSVLVFAPRVADRLCALAKLRVALLEQSWSRFRASSELSRMNARAGTGPVEVSSDLLTLVWHMQRAWELTEGHFDPTMLAQIKAAGYDADFATVIARDALAQARSWAAPRPSCGMACVSIDLGASTVAMPANIGLDPGAIGKGLAGDIIAAELMAAGAAGVLVDLGGDIVMAGAPGVEDSWAIAVEDERSPGDSSRESVVVRFDAASGPHAIATSSTLYRRWAGGAQHHVLDPRTGLAADPELVQATVWCGAGWLAEVSATAVLLMSVDEAITWLGCERGYALMTADQAFSALVGAP